jgi:hypothetical protein
MRYIVLICLLFTTIVFAEEPRVDCILLEDENSIICKYMTPRTDEPKDITVQWIDPNNEISRQRRMTIPEYHGSIYDYRYLQGRLKGVWTFKVIDADEEFTTNFTVE